MRKTIARRLSESLFTAPHFYLTVSIDMDNAIAARAQINEVAPVKVSYNDMVIKAVAASLKQRPNVNTSWQGDKIRYNEHTNVGCSYDDRRRFIQCPWIRFADGKTLSHISAEVKDYAQKAKAKKLQPSDWEGSTFTMCQSTVCLALMSLPQSSTLRTALFVSVRERSNRCLFQERCVVRVMS